MKKAGRSFIAIFLVLTIFVCALPDMAGADSTGICFTAVDDSILDLSLRPSFVGGSPYVPWTVFSSLGVSTSYFESENMALLSYGNIHMIFDLNEGTCKDADGNTYPVSATLLNGTVYLPPYTGIIFGFTYSYISGIGYGDVVRIKSGANVLTDSQFIDAAANKMYSMYSAYFGTPAPPATPTPSPTPSPEESEEPEKKGGDVFLSFTGIPDTELLDLLKSYRVTACFFLTANEALENGDILRRASGEGHSLGVAFDTEEELLEGAESIQRAAFLRPTLATGGDSETAEKNGFALYSPGKTVEGEADPSTVNLSLPTDGKPSDYLITCGQGTVKLMSSVLSYMSANKYTSAVLLEPNIR